MESKFVFASLLISLVLVSGCAQQTEVGQDYAEQENGKESEIVFPDYFG